MFCIRKSSESIAYRSFGISFPHYWTPRTAEKRFLHVSELTEVLLLDLQHDQNRVSLLHGPSHPFPGSRYALRDLVSKPRRTCPSVVRAQAIQSSFLFQLSGVMSNGQRKTFRIIGQVSGNFRGSVFLHLFLQWWSDHHPPIAIPFHWYLEDQSYIH